MEWSTLNDLSNPVQHSARARNSYVAQKVMSEIQANKVIKVGKTVCLSFVRNLMNLQ